jgi:membrane protease YdiL (CAAX protease family)
MACHWTTSPEMLEDSGASLTPRRAGDARVQGLNVSALLADFARFLVRPAYGAQPMAWGRAAALVLLAALALDLALGELVIWLTDLWDAKVGFLPEPIEQDETLAEELFFTLLFAPLVEEALFRGWLTGRVAALRFAVYGMVALALSLAALVLPDAYAATVGLAGLAVALAGLIHWDRTRHHDTAVPAWFTRHFHWFVWGSTLLFGLIHLGNFEPLTHPLGVLVVLPQTVGGLLLAYTRIRLGLGAAMAHHAAFNAVWMAGEYRWW